MQTVVEIEKAVLNLSKDEMISFRSWFIDLDQSEWDKKLESDIGFDNLKSLMNGAIEDFENGKCKKI